MGDRVIREQASDGPPQDSGDSGLGDLDPHEQDQQPHTKTGKGGDGGMTPPGKPSTAGGEEEPSKGDVDAAFTVFMADELAETAEADGAVERFNDLSLEEQEIALAAYAAQTQRVDYDPDYNKPFKEKLAGVYTKADPLIRTLCDISEPVFADQPDGPQAYTMYFSQEAIQKSGLGEDILGVSVITMDEVEEDGQLEPASITFRVKSHHQDDNITPFRIEQSGTDEDIAPGLSQVQIGKIDVYPSGEEGTIIVTRLITIYDPSSRPPETASVFEDFTTWPMKTRGVYEDVTGQNVFPTSDLAPDALHALKHFLGVDMNGCDVLMRLLDAESRIRQN